jgi:hypothetical protein
MTTPSLSTSSVARRVSLLSVAMLAGVLVLVSGVMAVVAESRSRI